MEDELRQVLQVFSEEFRDQAQLITDALLKAERAASTEERRVLFAEIFRHAHSIKGNAGTLGLADVESLAHALETCLTPCRSGVEPPPSAVVVAVLQALDHADRRVQSQLAGDDASDPGVVSAAAQLLALAAQAGGAPEADGRPMPVPLAPGMTPSDVERRPATETLRVSLERLASLDRKVDELRELRAALEHRSDELRQLTNTLGRLLHSHPEGLSGDLARGLRQELHQSERRLAGDVGDLQARLSSIEEELHTLRMLPVETILGPLKRAVWEQAHASGKSARLELSGAQVALDRRLLDELRDALLHLARNAVDHGLESPQERVAAGKPAEGLIRVEVEQRGSRVLLGFGDDGRGIDRVRVVERAVERGLLPKDRAGQLSPAEIDELLFVPGFTTANEVTLTSGRGVGLDVVKEKVQRVGGRVTVSSQLGRGARFNLELPLTLATAQVLAFEAAGITLTLPLASVVRAEFLPIERAELRTIDVAGQLLPVHSLVQLLNLRPPARAPKQAAVIVARASDGLLALRVDRLQGEREVVIRPNPPELNRLRHLSAAAALGDGKLAFVLNLRTLAQRAQRSGEDPAQRRGATHYRILVADDSVTTRTLHRQALEAAGYQVLVAADGEEALRILRGGTVQLLISDVRMPRLDGLSLTRAVRKEPGLESLPVVLVSSLDSAQDRDRAQEAGASAYLPKGALVRDDLLNALRSLLP